MNERPNPISLTIRIASGLLGTALVLIGVATLVFASGNEARIWWLPIAFGALFLVPLFSSSTRREQRPAILRRFRTFVRIERRASVLGFVGLLLCKVAYDRSFQSRGNIMEHPVLGPLVVVFAVLFLVGIVLQFFVAYYGSKAT